MDAVSGEIEAIELFISEITAESKRAAPSVSVLREVQLGYQELLVRLRGARDVMRIING